MTTTVEPTPRPVAAARIALLVVVAAFVTLAVVVAVRTPAWEAPDEPGHIQNVETLVRGHWYGFQPTCVSSPDETILSCTGDEAHQAPLYYLLLAGWQDVAGPQAQPVPVHSLVFHHGGHRRSEFFVHHPDRGLVLWLRLPNIALGVGTVLMTFLVLRRLARDAWTPVIGAAMLAFLPRFVFLSAVVTNDNLVVLLGSVLTYCAVRVLQSPTERWSVATGAALGLLFLTKITTLPLVLLLPVVVAFAPTWRRRITLGAWGILAAVVVSSWYFVQNAVRYGDPLARSASTTYLTHLGALGDRMGKAYVVKDPVNLVLNDVPTRLVTNFWYSSGWGQFHWPAAVGLFLTFGIVALLLGLVPQHLPVGVLVVLGTNAALALACVWLLAFQTGTYGDRYAYVGITAIVTLVALAVQRAPLLLRSVLPALGLLATVLAIHSDVLAIHWT